MIGVATAEVLECVAIWNDGGSNQYLMGRLVESPGRQQGYQCYTFQSQLEEKQEGEEGEDSENPGQTYSVIHTGSQACGDFDSYNFDTSYKILDASKGEENLCTTFYYLS